MTRMALKSCVAGWTFAIALTLGLGATARAESLVSREALLAVKDPARLQLRLAQAESPGEDQAAEDDETPAALYGEPPAAIDEAQTLSKQPPQPVDEEEESVFKTWWFWALTAGVVGGTVALGVWAAQPEDQPAGLCSPGVIACFGDGR